LPVPTIPICLKDSVFTASCYRATFHRSIGAHCRTRNSGIDGGQGRRNL